MVSTDTNEGILETATTTLKIEQESSGPSGNEPAENHEAVVALPAAREAQSAPFSPPDTAEAPAAASSWENNEESVSVIPGTADTAGISAARESVAASIPTAAPGNSAPRAVAAPDTDAAIVARSLTTTAPESAPHGHPQTIQPHSPYFPHSYAAYHYGADHVPSQGAPKPIPDVNAIVAALSKRSDPHYASALSLTSYTDAAALSDPPPDSRRNRGGVTEPFPDKLHRMLEYAEQEHLTDVVSFFTHGRAFAIHKPRRFVTEITPRFFRQSRLTSFQRQLNLYGFRRVSQGPDNGGYFHELFLKGRPGLSINMKRTKVKGLGKLKRDPDSDPNFYAMPPVLPASAATVPWPKPNPTSAPLTYPLAPAGGTTLTPFPYYPPPIQYTAPPYTAAQQSGALPSPAAYPVYPPPYPYYGYPPGYAYPTMHVLSPYTALTSAVPSDSQTQPVPLAHDAPKVASTSAPDGAPISNINDEAKAAATQV